MVLVMLGRDMQHYFLVSVLFIADSIIAERLTAWFVRDTVVIKFVLVLVSVHFAG